MMDEPDVEWNERGELAVHGQTSSAWTTAMTRAPLKNGGWQFEAFLKGSFLVGMSQYLGPK